MEETVKNDILNVLKQTLEILNQEYPDWSKLKELSNHTIHNSSIFQDEDSISIAVLIYSLSKLRERVKDNLDYSKIKNLLNLSIEYLEDDNLENYKDFIKQIFNIIQSADSKFKYYVQEVIRQASIRKGSMIYHHGISASRTAEILGISLWDFYEYQSATNMPDFEDIKSVRQRLKYARSLFT